MVIILQLSFRENFMFTNLKLDSTIKVDIDCGTLITMGKFDFKMLKDSSFKSRQIFIFRTLIVVCEIPRDSSSKDYKTLKTLCTKDYKHVDLNKCELTYFTYDNESMKDHQKSFVIRVKQTDTANQLHEEHNSLLKSPSSPYHKKLGKWFHNGSDKLPHQQPHCGRCNDLIKGRFSIGIKCDACQGLFHESCFQKSNEKQINLHFS